MYARARTIDGGRYIYQDGETGADVVVTIPAGRWVFIRTETDLGIHRPGCYGGGIEACAVDLNTGHTFRTHVRDVNPY